MRKLMCGAYFCVSVAVLACGTEPKEQQVPIARQHAALEANQVAFQFEVPADLDLASLVLGANGRLDVRDRALIEAPISNLA